MKFKTKKETLVRGIEILQNIISTKATLPILSNILMEVKQGNLRMTATDLNIGISCVIPVDTQEMGIITVPAKRFGSIIKELPDNEIEISSKKNNSVIIQTSVCEFKI